MAENLVLRKHENRALGEQIGPPRVRRHRTRTALLAERERTLNSRAAFAHQLREVTYRTEMDIRRFVPVVAQCGRPRHSPLEQECDPYAPVTEIRERDDGFFAYTQEMLKD